MAISSVKNELDQLSLHHHHLTYGHQSFSRDWLKDHAEEDSAVKSWLQARLNLPYSLDELAALPETERLHQQAWANYYDGRYPEAAAAFSQINLLLGEHPLESLIAADVALGLGKVYTRSGHWKSARSWLLQSLFLARNTSQLYLQTKGYGALSELLLRAGHSQSAHMCMTMAYHILPPGSAEQSRQINYMASTLMRNKANLRAESLLFTSLHMARDQKDKDSAWHALARLQFLWLTESRNQTIEEVIQNLEEYNLGEPPPVARCFIEVGRALCAARRSAPDATLGYLHSALTATGTRLPVERAWVGRLIAILEKTGYVPEPSLIETIMLSPASPVAREPVFDLTWAELHLDDGNFSWLQGSLPGSFEEEALRWHKFFI